MGVSVSYERVTPAQGVSLRTKHVKFVRGALDAGPVHCRAIQEQLLSRNVERFRRRLVLKAHTLLYHSTLGSRVIEKREEETARWMLAQSAAEQEGNMLQGWKDFCLINGSNQGLNLALSVVFVPNSFDSRLPVQ